MKVLYVTAEMPFSKVGGLGDVSSALPITLQELGIDIRVITPYYMQIKSKNLSIDYNITQFSIELGKIKSEVTIHSTIHNGILVYLVEIPFFFNRPGIYTSDDGRGYSDNDERFASFSWAVLECLNYLHWFPDIIHMNDWHSAFIPAWMQMEHFRMVFQKYKKPKTLLTIHNIVYQGNFSVEKYEILGINDPEIKNLFTFLDNGNPLKSAIISADAISTVSKSYAKEILDPEYGSQMEIFLKNRVEPVYGILNGVDYNIWSPENDSLIPAKFSISDLTGKATCKRMLQEKFHLRIDPTIPLIGMVSRLATQKGFDIFIPILRPLLEKVNFQLIAYVNGNKMYADALKEIESQYSDKISINIAYDERMSHWIEAGSDFFLMPSKYEPCGLNQLYSLRYGTIPIVRATGGLKDTIIDILDHSEEGTGFSFNDYSSMALQQTIEHTILWFTEIFKKHTELNDIRKRLMKKDYSWDSSAKQYDILYREILT